MNKNVTIYAHTLVKNEENYLWFSVMSVIDYVDKVFIWDTGSTDKTPQIIKEIEKARPGKVYFKEVGEVDINEFTTIRQRMLEETDSDWFILVDGDEVWWDEKIKGTVEFIQKSGDKFDSLVHKYLNPVGDIYHIQDENAGRYKLDEKTGYLTIRAMNRAIGGLNVLRPYGQEGFFNDKGTLIQEMDPKRRLFINGFFYMHFSNLPRSSGNFDTEVLKRNMKYKYELGKSLPLDFYYPEVFFRLHPEVVPDPWVKRNSYYVLRAGLESPLKNLKRKFFPSNRSGY